TVDKLLPRFFRKYRQGSVCQLTNPDGMALTDVSWPTATNNPRGTSRKADHTDRYRLKSAFQNKTIPAPHSCFVQSVTQHKAPHISCVP
ncbi:hypothetical protein JOQ06_010963, partial [Pogonophryne albipinna]